MHRYVTPQSVKDRVLRRQGKPLAMKRSTPAAPRWSSSTCRIISSPKAFPPKCRRRATSCRTSTAWRKALRAAGGTVVWIQTTAVGALEQLGQSPQAHADAGTRRKPARAAR